MWSVACFMMAGVCCWAAFDKERGLSAWLWLLAALVFGYLGLRG